MNHKPTIKLSKQEYRDTKKNLEQMKAINGQISASLLQIELANDATLEKAKRCLERVNILLKK